MNANQSGQAVEEMIAALLTSIGVMFREDVRVGVSVFDTGICADFVLENLASYPRGLIIEAKWQDRDGSTDEKYCFLIENIRSGRYPLPTLIIADGAGARPGAIAYLKGHVDGHQLIAVQTIREFVSWVLRAPRV